METHQQNLESLFNKYSTFKEGTLSGRYITYTDIENLLVRLSTVFEVETIGHSNNAIPIRTVKVGDGPVKILAWSQMHGNESTTTKAVFDVLNAFRDLSEMPLLNSILEKVSLIIIPMLNPDGAEAYTRVNANNIDLNRDAKDLTQAESRVLREELDRFQPHYCFNLHDQRTIFGAGAVAEPATISFLTPSMDDERSIQPSRMQSMKVIATMVKDLELYIKGKLGRYDDAYNENCTGDTFQTMNIPTILFEAGHYPNDYNREETRKYICYAIFSALNAITNRSYEEMAYEDYFKIPENEKNFFDVILRNARIGEEVKDVAIQFKEVLHLGKILFEPIVVEISDKLSEFGHREIDCENNKVTTLEKEELIENVIVDKIAIKNEILIINYENN